MGLFDFMAPGGTGFGVGPGRGVLGQMYPDLDQGQRQSMALMGIGDLLRGGSGSGAIGLADMMSKGRKAEADKAKAESERQEGLSMTAAALRGMGPQPKVSYVAPSPTSAEGIAADAMAAIGQGGFTPGDKESFVRAMMPYALEASKQTGLDPRLIIAQSAQETGWGKHAPGGNFFGIKSHGAPSGQTLSTTEYVDGKPVSINDSFRTYGGMGESVQGYADFLKQNPRYSEMLGAQGLDAQLQALGQSGYATDPNYASTVGSIARSIDIDQSAMPSVDPERAAQIMASPNVPDAVKQMVLSQYMPQQQKPGYQTITGDQAQSMGLDPSRAYNVGPDGKITQIGGAGTNITIGGEQKPTPFQEAVDKDFAKQYTEWKTTGAVDTSRQVAQIGNVLDQLEEGAPLTGPVVGAISNVGLGAIFAPDAQDARDQVESVVQRSLRETLGAQFTAAEGERLIARAYNVNLPPEYNVARLKALYSTLSAADAAKRAMIEYVDANGTLAGYQGPTIPNADQIIAQMETAAPSQAVPAGDQSGAPVSDDDLLKMYGGQ